MSFFVTNFMLKSYSLSYWTLMNNHLRFARISGLLDKVSSALPALQ